jgi:hypothetical protein
MADNLTIALNTLLKAPSQYINMPFDSVVEFNGKAVFFGESGVFEECGQDDDGTSISAWIDTPLHDFGRPDQKSIEAFDLGYESSGNLTVTLYAAEDDVHARTFTVTPRRPDQVQQDETRTLKKYKYGKSRYWGVRIANVNGCDFSLDYFALAPVFYKRRSRG